MIEPAPNRVKDLGLLSQSDNELFPFPSSPEEWMSYALSEEQVAHFKEHGYLKGVRILNEGDVLVRVRHVRP